MQPHINERTATHDRRLGEVPYPSTPGLWPLRQAARFAGLSVNGFVAGVENGDIPVTLRRIGPGGKRFVSVEPLLLWLSQAAPTSCVAGGEDLF